MNPAIRNLPLSLVPFLVAGYQFQTGVAPPPGMSFAQLQTALWAKQIAAGPRTTFYNYSHNNAQQFNGVVNQTRWDISDNLTVRNIFGATWRRNKGPAIDVDGGDLPLVDTRSVIAPGATNLFDPKYAWAGGDLSGNPARKFSDELQFQGKLFDDRFHWQAGGFWDQQSNPDFTPNSLIWVFTQLASAPDPENGASCVPVTGSGATQCLSTLITSKQSDKAIYGQGTFAITDTLHFTAGLRHSWASREVSTGLTNTDFFVFNGFPQPLPISGRSPIAGSVTTQTVPTEQRNTYNLALDWQVTDNVLLYVTRRTGYKAGGINENTPAGSPDRLFGPETLKDVELGAKTQWTIGGVSGRANLALFRDNYSSIQTSNIIPGTATTVTINSAAAIIQGAEFEVAARFSDWLDLNAWYAYLDAHYTDFTQTLNCSPSSEYWYPQCATATVPRQLVLDNAHGNVTIQDLTAGGPVTIASFSGPPEVFANAAKNTFSVQPTIHFLPWLGQDISLTANIQYASTARIPNNVFPGIQLAPVPAGSTVPSEGPFVIPSHVTTDVRLDWRRMLGTKLNGAIVATNVTNTLYNISNAAGFTISGGFEYIYNEPRMVYVEFRYPFGSGS